MKWHLDTSRGQLTYLMKAGTELDRRGAHSVLMGRPEGR